jgi:hypothetical protein
VEGGGGQGARVLVRAGAAAGTRSLKHSSESNALNIVVVLGDDCHKIGDEVHRVESDTELTNQRHITPVRHLLQEVGGARFGNGAEVVDQVFLRHTDALVDDGQCACILVEFDL